MKLAPRGLGTAPGSAKISARFSKAVSIRAYIVLELLGSPFFGVHFSRLRLSSLIRDLFNAHALSQSQRLLRRVENFATMADRRSCLHGSPWLISSAFCDGNRRNASDTYKKFKTKLLVKNRTK